MCQLVQILYKKYEFFYPKKKKIGGKKVIVMRISLNPARFIPACASLHKFSKKRCIVIFYSKFSEKLTFENFYDSKNQRCMCQLAQILKSHILVLVYGTFNSEGTFQNFCISSRSQISKKIRSQISKKILGSSFVILYGKFSSELTFQNFYTRSCPQISCMS